MSILKDILLGLGDFIYCSKGGSRAQARWIFKHVIEMQSKMAVLFGRDLVEVQ